MKYWTKYHSDNHKIQFKLCFVFELHMFVTVIEVIQHVLFLFNLVQALFFFLLFFVEPFYPAPGDSDRFAFVRQPTPHSDVTFV